MTPQTKFPIWILIVSALFALMEIGYAIGATVSPQAMMENVDHSAKGVSMLVAMLAARQFALGVLFVAGIIKKSAPMLTAAYLFCLVMFLGDIAIGAQQNENTMMIGGVVMSVIALLMLWAVNKKR